MKSIKLKNHVPIGQRRIRHVVSKVQHVSEAIKALKEANLILFGKLMNDSHISLRDNYELTNSVIRLNG